MISKLLFVLMIIAMIEISLFNIFHQIMDVDFKASCNCPDADFHVLNFQGVINGPACAVPHKWACSEIASFSIAFHEMLHKQFGMEEYPTILMGNFEAVLLWFFSCLLGLRILGVKVSPKDQKEAILALQCRFWHQNRSKDDKRYY